MAESETAVKTSSSISKYITLFLKGLCPIATLGLNLHETAFQFSTPLSEYFLSEFCRQDSEAEIPAWHGLRGRRTAEHINTLKIDMVALLKGTGLCNHAVWLSIPLRSENREQKGGTYSSYMVSLISCWGQIPFL